ncbi:MAG: hypothetical protein ACLFR0_09610 [Alphaproteobacteria bacterium]
MDSFLKIMDTLFYPFTAFMDWAYKNDIGMAGEMAGLFTIAGAYVAAAVAPFAIKAHFNGKALDRKCQALDKTTTQVFNAAADENAYSEFQKQAVKSAHHVINKIGNGWSYSSERKCAENHKDYSKNTYPLTQTTIVNNVPIVTTTIITEFNPHIVGYQVAANDAELAMPLYSSTQEGYGLRPDGAQIAL